MLNHFILLFYNKSEVAIHIAMPKITQDALIASAAAPKRRSARKPKLEVVMPEGYNPSDDSEYVEMAASKRRSKDSIARSQRKRKHETRGTKIKQVWLLRKRERKRQPTHSNL